MNGTFGVLLPTGEEVEVGTGYVVVRVPDEVMARRVAESIFHDLDLVVEVRNQMGELV